jgi:hypothetical protein
LAVTYTDAEGNEGEETVIAQGAPVDLDLEPDESVAIRLLDEADDDDQDEAADAFHDFDLMDHHTNVVARLTLRTHPQVGAGALEWAVEAQEGPHPGAPLHQLVLDSASQLRVEGLAEVLPGPASPPADEQDEGDGYQPMNLLEDGAAPAA